jgi:hypothetical protein
MNISVGYGLEPILTDALSGRIIRDVVTPKFKTERLCPAASRTASTRSPQQIQLHARRGFAARAAAADERRTRSRRRRRLGRADLHRLHRLFLLHPADAHQPRAARQEAAQAHRPWGAPIIIWGDDDWGGGSGGSSWGGGGSSWGGGGGELGRWRRLLGRRRLLRRRRRLGRLVGGCGHESQSRQRTPTMISSPQRSPLPRRIPAARSSPSSRRSRTTMTMSRSSGPASSPFSPCR